MPDTATPDSTGRPEAAAYEPTERTVPTRARERASYDQETVHSILDEAYLCHLGFVRDGAPVVLPDALRPGRRAAVRPRLDRIAPAAQAARAADPGLAVCLTVTHVDGLVLARSAFHHSMNYRSVVVHGTATQVTDPEERRIALDAIVDQVVPGRVGGLPARRREGARRHRGDPPGPRRGLRQDPHGRPERRPRGPRRCRTGRAWSRWRRGYGGAGAVRRPGPRRSRCRTTSTAL